MVRLLIVTGKGVTDEAVIRGSMGSVIIEFIFDKMRERDHQSKQV